MAVINFVGVTLRQVSRETGSGKLYFTAELTPAISRAFEWDAISDKATSSDMDGEISGGTLTLSPKELGMKLAAFTCEFGTLNKLEIVRLEIEKTRGKGHRSEVRFVVKFSGADTAAKAERWLTKIGEAKGTLEVSYAKQDVMDLKPPKQGKLDADKPEGK